MAAEAVLRIKAAEDRGSELIRQATEDAREIIRRATVDGIAKKNAMIAEAEIMKSETIRVSEQNARAKCSDFVNAGQVGKMGYLNPSDATLDKAAQMIAERIVNTYGNR